MSLLLTIGGQKAEKLKKTNWNMFYGTPCTFRTEQLSMLTCKHVSRAADSYQYKTYKTKVNLKVEIFQDWSIPSHPCFNFEIVDIVEFEAVQFKLFINVCTTCPSCTEDYLTPELWIIAFQKLYQIKN